MTTNKLLLKVARGLQYQHLPEIIGADVTIDSLSLIFDSVSDLAQQHCSISPATPDDLEAVNRKLAGPIGKYGLIDFEFAVDAKIDGTKTDNIQLLRDFGFSPAKDGESEDQMFFDDDPEYCVREIHDQISRDQVWLKLFFRTTSLELSEMDWKNKLRQTLNLELIQFPLSFRCVDACLTNSPFIWFSRHFYL